MLRTIYFKSILQQNYNLWNSHLPTCVHVCICMCVLL